MVKTKEQRVYPRLNVYHLAKYRLLSKPEGRLVEASAKNISGGGICLRAEEELPVSTVVQLYINFPHFSKSVPILARVIWKKKLKKTGIFEMGIRFVEIEEILHSEVIRRIEYILKKFGKGR